MQIQKDSLTSYNYQRLTLAIYAQKYADSEEFTHCLEPPERLTCYLYTEACRFRGIYLRPIITREVSVSYPCTEAYADLGIHLLAVTTREANVSYLCTEACRFRRIYLLPITTREANVSYLCTETYADLERFTHFL
jgi:hypothetical protein